MSGKNVSVADLCDFLVTLLFFAFLKHVLDVSDHMNICQNLPIEKSLLDYGTCFDYLAQ